MTSLKPPIILIIEDDERIGRWLRRVAERAFPSYQGIWARNGVVGVGLAHQHADCIRLVVLDVQMDLMDGTLTAAQLRRAIPQVPIMPFTGHEEALPTLSNLGCVLPLVKRPDVLGAMPELMQRAMDTPVPPVPDCDWVTALGRSGDSVLAFVERGEIGTLLMNDGQAAVNVQRAMHWLDKYCRRVRTPAAREIQLAHKALREVTGE